MDFICRKWNEDKTNPIDLVGHSRGGAIVNEVAKTLEYRGCCDNKTKRFVKPIRVRFLGLYDPINMTMNSWNRYISLNASRIVDVYAIAPPNGKRSRDLWNRVDQGFTWPPTSNETIVRIFYIPGTHSALGGDPFHGDYPAGHSLISNILAYFFSDIVVRMGYIEAGGKLR